MATIDARCESLIEYIVRVAERYDAGAGDWRQLCARVRSEMSL